MTRVIYKGRKFDVGPSFNPGQVVLWEGLPDNPEPYATITEEELSTLKKVA